MTKLSPGERLAQWGRFLEDGLLVTLLIALIVIATLQIFLRNVFGGGLANADEFLRILVLWLAILGGLAASRDERHISIGVITRKLQPKAVAMVKSLVCFFVALVCAFIASASLSLVTDAYEYKDTVLNGQPAWLVQLILPVGFALMSWRYLVHCRPYVMLLLTLQVPDDPD